MQVLQVSRSRSIKRWPGALLAGSLLALLCMGSARAAPLDVPTDAQCRTFQDKVLELAGYPVLDPATSHRAVIPMTHDLIAFLQRYDWLLHEPRTGGQEQLLMEADGFRTRTARFFSCFHRLTPSWGGDCIVGVMREDDDALTEQSDMIVVLELLKHFGLNLNHLTLPEIKDFNA